MAVPGWSTDVGANPRKPADILYVLRADEIEKGWIMRMDGAEHLFHDPAERQPVRVNGARAQEPHARGIQVKFRGSRDPKKSHCASILAKHHFAFRCDLCSQDGLPGSPSVAIKDLLLVRRSHVNDDVVKVGRVWFADLERSVAKFKRFHKIRRAH